VAGFSSLLVETWQGFIGVWSQVDVDKYPFLITLHVCLAAFNFLVFNGEILPIPSSCLFCLYFFLFFLMLKPILFFFFFFFFGLVKEK